MAPKSKSKSKSKTRNPRSSTAPSTQGRENPGPQRPDWPPLTQPIAMTEPSLTTLIPNQVLLVPHLLSTGLCKTYINFLSTLPLVTTPGKPKRGEAVRVNDRFQVDDNAFANDLWIQTGLRELVTDLGEAGVWGGEVLGLNANIRVYRYQPGQFFDKHYDESNQVKFGDAAVAGKTTWTLLVYLSRCQGGETVFHPEVHRKGPPPEPVVVEVEAGLALLHRHGDECLLHEGREVTGGEKWVLRSDLVVRR